MCPPADKKAKMEKVSDDFSLEFGLDAKVDTKPKTGDVSFIGVDKKTLSPLQFISVDVILDTHVDY